MVKKHIVVFFGITMAVAQVQQPPSSGVIPSTIVAPASPVQIAQKQQEVTALQKQLDESLNKNAQLKNLEDERINLKKQVSALQDRMELDADQNQNALAAYQQSATSDAVIPQNISTIMQNTKTNKLKLTDYTTKLKSVEGAIKRIDPGRLSLLKKLQTSAQELKEMNSVQPMQSVADRPL